MSLVHCYCSVCMLDLYIKVLEENLAEIAYDADVAALRY